MSDVVTDPGTVKQLVEVPRDRMPGQVVAFPSGTRVVTHLITAECRKNLDLRLNRVEYQEVNLEFLTQFRKDSEVTPEVLREADLIDTLSRPVVILSRGELKKPLKVKPTVFPEKPKKRLKRLAGL